MIESMSKANDFRTPIEYLSKFLDYLEVNDIYSDASRIRAVRSLRYLSDFMPLENPSREQIEKYVLYAKRNKGNANKTIENHLAALVHYNRMLGIEIWVPKSRKEYADQQYVATREDLQKILKYCAAQPEKEYSHLLTAIFLASSSTGARVGELARINIDDLKNDGIYIRAEKREGNRIVGVAPEVMEYLVDFRDNWRLRPTDPSDKGLFVWYYREAKGVTVAKRYSADSLRNLIREKAKAAGCEGVNSHSLRRFAATELFRQNADFRRVQFHLGHSDPKSTLRYVKMVDEIEARRNAELLRPFFQEIIEREVRNNMNWARDLKRKIVAGNQQEFSNTVANPGESNAPRKIAGIELAKVMKTNAVYNQMEEQARLEENETEILVSNNTKEVKRVRGKEVYEPNNTRGEGFEPSLSIEKQLSRLPPYRWAIPAHAVKRSWRSLATCSSTSSKSSFSRVTTSPEGRIILA